MLNIFYRENGKIGVSQSEKDFAKITLENTVWIDLVDPSGAEKRAVEGFLGTEIQSRAQAEENVREFRQMLERLKSLLIS